ncbi:MAG TPA: putative peptidoglycan binding domain-containing protein [Candidatus Sulfotelmatobacter sp.]|nr:putative peptidoglycan binding domain-containing protein [Candidatus Sulfotelmatobacter sp.]
MINERRFAIFAVILALVLSRPLAARAWERQDFKDPLSGNGYARLVTGPIGTFAIAGVAAGAPLLGLECGPGEGGRRSLQVDITFPTLITRESYVSIDYQFAGHKVHGLTAVLIKPERRFLLQPHSFEFVEQMLAAPRVDMEFLIPRSGSPILGFDLSDHGTLHAFVKSCYADIDMVPPELAPGVAEYLLQDDADGVRAVQSALKGLGLYQGAADGARSPDLFRALQNYAVAQKADEVAVGEWEHLTRRSLAGILRHDARIPADVREKL